VLCLQVCCVYRCVDVFTGVLCLQVCCDYRCVVITGVLCLRVCCVYRCVVITGVLCLQVCCDYRCVCVYRCVCNVDNEQLFLCCGRHNHCCSCFSRYFHLLGIYWQFEACRPQGRLVTVAYLSVFILYDLCMSKRQNVSSQLRVWVHNGDLLSWYYNYSLMLGYCPFTAASVNILIIKIKIEMLISWRG